MTATLFRHLNEKGKKVLHVTKGILSHVRRPLEEKWVWLTLLSLSFLSSEYLY